MVGPAPEGLIDLAASSQDPSVLYAATQQGLRKSEDGGRSWADAHLLRRPATMVQVTPDGRVYAFVIGQGLIRTKEPSLPWETVGDSFGEMAVLHLAADPSDEEKLYAVALNPETHEQRLLTSEDGGQTWAPLGEGTH